MNETNEGASRSRRRAAHMSASSGDSDLPPSFLCQFHGYWREFEEQIDALQNQKKLMLANVRARYGRHHAEALKIAMRWMLTDPAKRAEQAVQ